MIPLQLTLKNFLSYREATLDFSGLHTACICGANGAGKSSLLEALTWAIWGESRAASEDDVIHAGAKEVRVDFIFQCNQQTYRIIRTRHRGQSGTLEFQIATGEDFRSLTGRGIRATQQLIVHHLKLDYETFINSSYLRQGRADEFMLKKPTERKQILADLLKLDRYEELAEQAKESSRQYKAQAEQLEQSLQGIQTQLLQRETISRQKAELETGLNGLQQAQAADNEQIQNLQAIQQQRVTWEQQLGFVKQQQLNLTQDCERLQQEINITQANQKSLETLLNQEEQISAGYAHYQNLVIQEETLTSKFQAFQDAQHQRQVLSQQLTQQVNELNLQLRQTQGQLETLKQSREDIQHTLSRAEDVEAGLGKLQQARAYVSHLDQLQVQVAPLLQRRLTLQGELDRAQTRLNARLEELDTAAYQLENVAERQPQLRQAVMEVADQLEHLEKRRVYQQRVQEKGLERRSFMERLQENQREYERKLAELDQKLQMLQTPGAACPLCDRPMDENHTHHVLEKTQAEQQEVQGQFWVVREQLAVCEREIQVLRQEYAQLSRELAGYNSLLEQRGQLAAQLEETGNVQHRLKEIVAEAHQLDRSLKMGDFAAEVRQELERIDQQLQQLNYDERNHTLARSEVERWRWAEIKQAEIKQALRRQAQIDTQLPELLAKINSLQTQIHQLQTDSDLTHQISALEQQITEIGYDRSQHESLRASLRQSQAWQLRYQEWQRAKQEYPQLRERAEALNQSLQGRLADRQTLETQLNQIIQQLKGTPDTRGEIQALEQQMQQRRRQLDTQLSQLGSLQQQLQHLDSLQTQQSGLNTQLQTVRKQYRVYQELAQAFGKNGIQTLMIENLLPQLEAETNSVLSRLSGNQLHVQFVTQKAGRSGKAAKKSTKLIDTLDILIADARGTRPYETYSGGEAFRINFAIRLALAKLLAQRAGTALQMLIVDEGFGTQDSDGCERLIAAINAIAPDFACILTVTHMPAFKEAFQARIEVYKSENGSQLSLSI